MKTMLTFAFLVISLTSISYFRCPCQETRKPGNDKSSLVCGDDRACNCGCEQEEKAANLLA